MSPVPDRRINIAERHYSFAGKLQLVGVAGEVGMSVVVGPLDPETLAILRAAFDDARRFVPRQFHSPEVRPRIAESLLRIGADGERDPERLRNYALRGIAASPRDPDRLLPGKG